MSLTAKDILEKTFKKAFKGYDEDEVDKFLDEVIDEFKALKAENEALKKQIKEVKELESSIKDTEDTIMNTLVSAQKSSERILRDAARKAELLIDNAENTAKQKTERTTKDLAEMERKLAAIKQSAGNFAESFSAMMSAQAKAFEETYQSYFGDMDAYSSSGINLEALENLDKNIAGDISKLVGAAVKPADTNVEPIAPLNIDEEQQIEEDIEQLEVEWKLPQDEIPQLEDAARGDSAEPESDAEPEEPEAEPESEAEPEETEAEPEETEAEPEETEAEPEETKSEIVKNEPAVPLEPTEPDDDEESKPTDSMPLNEINKVLTDLEEQDDEEGENAKYDDYSWLYGDDNKKEESEFELSFKDPKESEELKNLIDDVIE